MGIEYFCAICRQRLRGSQYKVEVQDNGKLRIVARCCGIDTEFMRELPMAGIINTTLTPGTEAYGREWERLSQPPPERRKQEAADHMLQARRALDPAL